MPDFSALLNVVLLSLMAGLGTGLGGLIAVLRRPGRRSYGLLMGITAGVMICLSFLELVNRAWELGGFITATIGFGVGATFMFLLDHFAPHIRFGEKEIPGGGRVEPPCPCEEERPQRRHFGRLPRDAGEQSQRGLYLHRPRQETDPDRPRGLRGGVPAHGAGLRLTGRESKRPGLPCPAARA